MSDEKSSDANWLDALFKEYDCRFSEIMKHLDLYHRQTNFLQIYISVVIIGSVQIFSNKAVIDFFDSNPDFKKYFYLIALIVGVVILFYLYSSTLVALQTIFLNAERIGAIEKYINKKFGKDLLIWESKIAPQYFNPASYGKKLWIKPNIFAPIWGFVLIVAMCAVFVFLCYIFLPTFFWGYLIVVSVVLLFHIIQCLLLLTKGREHISVFVNEMSNFATNKTAREK